MKIAFTNNGNSYTLESIKDFATDLSKRFETTQKPGKNQFVADFALLDMMADNIEISSFDDLVSHASAWHGVKELGEIGFDDDEYRHLIFDYYGGGSMFITNYNSEWSDEEEVFTNIDKTLTDIFDVTSDEWVLLVQWTEDKCLVEDRESEQADAQENLDVVTEAIECCPHCGCENVYPNWDVKTQGYVAKCKDCGKDILLCDECLHADDNPGQKCNWSKERGCFRCPKNQTKPTDKPQDDKRYYIDVFRLEEVTDVVVESDWMTEEDAMRWFQSTINFVQYGNYGVRLMHAVGDDDCYDVEVVKNLY